MKFRNETDHELSFELRGVDYKVAPSSDVDIPERVAYAISLQGIPLTCLERPAEPTIENDVRSVDEWRAAALEARKSAESANAAMRRADARAIEAETAMSKLAMAKDKSMAELTETVRALQGNVGELQAQLAAVTADRDELLAAATKPEAGKAGKPSGKPS